MSEKAGLTSKPKFGEWLRGIYASESNPQRDGMYVRTIRRTGRMNPGTFYEMTDGNGRFWQYPAQSVERVAAPQPPTEAQGVDIDEAQDDAIARVAAEIAAEAQPQVGIDLHARMFGDRMAINMLVAAGYVAEAKANEALNIAHGFAKGPLEQAQGGGEPVAHYCEHRHKCKWRANGPWPSFGTGEGGPQAWKDAHTERCGGRILSLYAAPPSAPVGVETFDQWYGRVDARFWNNWDACNAAFHAGQNSALAQQPAAVDGDWRKKAAEWLGAKAVEQEAANQMWPSHAARYKEWRDRPGILRHLAIQVLAAQQGGE